jgi:putative FmdB family regulatory protein
MATYEYLCLACEHPFEQRRSMTSPVDTALACPSCGSDRVRRRFSFATTGGATPGLSGGAAPGIAPGPAGGGGCCGGGGCACGG